ncbi:MAG: sulfurtransferase [Acidobacteria bacterium]|nr:sulfurtransferase [Acidobacteriota bacterium]
MPNSSNRGHEVLVSTNWVADRLSDPSVRIVESDEDVLLYDTGHIANAVKVDWHSDLNDERIRDYIDARQFERLMGRIGVTNDTTVVLYGDKSNWWACYAYWVFAMFGHKKLKIMDGSRKMWLDEKRPITQDAYQFPETTYKVAGEHRHIRAFRTDVLRHLGNPDARQESVKLPAGRALVDVRSPGEFSGELLHMPDYPQEGAIRGGHIPGAVNIPWGVAVADDGTFRSAEEIRKIYEAEGVTSDKDVVVYCRIGERSALTWFVLHELLGFPKVRNYDGSWTEWGNVVGLPVRNPSLERRRETAQKPSARPAVGAM